MSTEVKLGVTYSPRELVVETEEPAERIAGLVDEAVGGKTGVLWLSDVYCCRVGIPTEKLAYVEVGEENQAKRVGFSSV